MKDVVGVRFKERGKIYYFAPHGEALAVGDAVIVETARGIEYGYVAIAHKTVADDNVIGDLKPVLRIATEADRDRYIANRNLAREALLICEKKVAEHGLDMHLISSEYTFDNSKLLFYFTADERVDFRRLVRDLAAIFRTRIELRQIGVRDEAKMIGGIGGCGRECCCSSYLTEFSSVGIHMAKDQGLSLNPDAISGVCGRLLCCLRYEQEGYEENLKRLPRPGKKVVTPEGRGVVVETSTLRALVKVKIHGDDGFEYHVFPADELEREAACGQKGCGGGCRHEA
ncbi:cell fate regulator YaaT (PSP1 superfamily) [Peptoniphilus ivorii]|uniref:PSP1 domain-containing protein n=1 Tax=Aedoeadaptatus ivorii TaxID=54006 RepID=UPI00278B5E8E|nr:stage 0 sporulation family protein [Peptoniphilus ivorii]MDQ0508333.1 cell fate regulator YaaT (PSP1 superfamily) [Peptoniphilus ivorii]